MFGLQLRRPEKRSAGGASPLNYRRAVLLGAFHERLRDASGEAYGSVPVAELKT